MKTMRGEAENTQELFESMAVPKALWKMALPSIASQLILLFYNVADTWFIGRTDNPYMVAASSLVLTIFLATTALANLFGTGGGTLVARLLGSKQEDEARRAASLSLAMAAGAALLFSLSCLFFMDPLLRFLGASDNTIGYAREYLFFVVVLGALPAILSSAMSAMVRNIGHSKEAGFGMSFGCLLNVALDPIFMFVLLPEGYEVMGAGIATMLSNLASFLYFVCLYRKLRDTSILELPKRVERVTRSSLRSIFSVGLPAAMSVLLFDLTNIVINRLCAAHGDIELAAIGIVLKVERLPLNIGIGICLGMVPLLAYNFAAGDRQRMYGFFKTARLWGIAVAATSVLLYYLCASPIMELFISDAHTIYYGVRFLRARCFATPFMFLSFHMVHFMQAVNQGRCSFLLALIRQICLNIPLLFIMDHFFGVDGVVHTQALADCINVAVAYWIYHRVVHGGALEPPVRF